MIENIYTSAPPMYTIVYLRNAFHTFDLIHSFIRDMTHSYE